MISFQIKLAEVQRPNPQILILAASNTEPTTNSYTANTIIVDFKYSLQYSRVIVHLVQVPVLGTDKNSLYLIISLA